MLDPLRQKSRILSDSLQQRLDRKGRPGSGKRKAAPESAPAALTLAL
jgi:hypothetical protein